MWSFIASIRYVWWSIRFLIGLVLPIFDSSLYRRIGPVVLRILHVVPTYLPARRYGGPIVAVHGLCKALAARGHEVDVFTTNVDGDSRLDVPVATPVDVDGVSVRYFPSSYSRLYWSRSYAAALHEPVSGRRFWPRSCTHQILPVESW